MAERKPVVVVIGVGEEEPLPEPLRPLEGRAELRPAANPAELDRALQGAEVVLVWDFRSSLLSESWERADVRWVHVAGAGVDAVLTPELAESDVVLTNARGVFDRSIAEFVAGVALVFAKDMVSTLEYQRSREWRHRETEMLAGSRALVVGAGDIGRSVAATLSALGVEVTGVATTSRTDEVMGTVHAIDDLGEVLGEADWVVSVLPLTDATRGVFGREQFGAMKPTARFINVGRGELVVEDDLVDALRDGVIAGAALDVFENEPLPEGSPLWGMSNVIVSPHMSGDFIGWLDALAVQFTENLDRWVEGRPLENTVDKARGYVARRRS